MYHLFGDRYPIKYESDTIKRAALVAMFHDIGKIVEPEVKNANIIDAPSPSVKKDHTWLGFDMLRKKHEFPLASAHVALQHHEHSDGTGQPRQLGQTEIHQYAKITAIANFYDKEHTIFIKEVLR